MLSLFQESNSQLFFLSCNLKTERFETGGKAFKARLAYNAAVIIVSCDANVQVEKLNALNKCAYIAVHTVHVRIGNNSLSAKTLQIHIVLLKNHIEKGLYH